jgi:formylglycine-generating enzyme required for sulfatase activity
MAVQKTPLVLLLLVLCNTVFANNLQVSNFQKASVNTVSGYAMLRFDLSWENGWRDATNWDAAWIFIKYRAVGSSAAWQHATLNLTGHTAATSSTVDAAPDGKGAFIYRNATGSGNTNFTNIQLRWNYAADGVASTDNIDIKIFGVEMVYVPQGSFFLGDGQTDGTQVYGNFEAGNTGTPFQVTSENSITLGGSGAGSLGNNNRTNQYANGLGGGTTDCAGDGCAAGSGDDFNDATSQTLPANFPKGYNAYYCMKYEMTQQQFVDMLNCLTPTQQNTYLASTTSFYYTGSLESNRYGITQTGGVYSTSTPNVPMIFFDWIKAAAYGDWSALRPMTELEFEKACRGTIAPVVNEYAWGNANLDLNDNLTISNADLDNESIASGFTSNGTHGNAWMRAGSQTMPNVARVGIFAAHPSNNGRISSGSSYWGIMEMTGNAWERAVSVGHAEGRKFTGLHGDGNLSANGYANVTNWPGTFAGSTVESNVGMGYRGGGLAYPTPNLERSGRVSSRIIASGYFNVVINDDGVRFVRTAN